MASEDQGLQNRALVTSSGKRKEKLRHSVVARPVHLSPAVSTDTNGTVAVPKWIHSHTQRPGQKVKDLIGPEREAALKAMQTGVYVGWRCPDLTWDCFRVGDSSMCFCGHHLYEHGKYTGSSVRVPCLVPSCSCGAFAFMPSRPEEVGEPWVRGRPGFDSQVWRALCRCKHPHQQHSPRAGHSCRVGGPCLRTTWPDDSLLSPVHLVMLLLQFQLFCLWLWNPDLFPGCAALSRTCCFGVSLYRTCCL
uniref:Uncharacterized protein n=1 Tax=Oncorhynchus tshawytscha TaxID=74940 RepID=A0AAZ3QQ02_ONCTS